MPIAATSKKALHHTITVTQTRFNLSDSSERPNVLLLAVKACQRVSLYNQMPARSRCPTPTNSHAHAHQLLQAV